MLSQKTSQRGAETEVRGVDEGRTWPIHPGFYDLSASGGERACRSMFLLLADGRGRGRKSDCFGLNLSRSEVTTDLDSGGLKSLVFHYGREIFRPRCTDHDFPQG